MRENEDGWRLSSYYCGNACTGALVLTSYTLGSLGQILFWFGKQEWVEGFQSEAENVEALVTE